MVHVLVNFFSIDLSKSVPQNKQPTCRKEKSIRQTQKIVNFKNTKNWAITLLKETILAINLIRQHISTYQVKIYK